MPDTTLVRCMRLFRQVYADTRGQRLERDGGECVEG